VHLEFFNINLITYQKKVPPAMPGTGTEGARASEEWQNRSERERERERPEGSWKLQKSEIEIHEQYRSKTVRE
jgi:hypothetical protein